MTPAIKKNLLFRPPPVLRRAVAAWKAGVYDPATDALVDLSGHGLNMRLGSAVGADTNDPLRLSYAGKYVYFPGSTGNSLSLPRPVASVDYTVTYSDGTTATGNSTADPIVFGTTDVQFSGLKVTSIVLTNHTGGAVVGSITAAGLTEPYANYTDPQGNVWTLNRSASSRKLCVVDRDLLLLGTDDYLEVADHALLNFSETESFTIALLMRQYGTHSSTRAYVAKKAGAALSDTGWAIYTDNNAIPLPARFNIGTNATDVTASYVDPASGMAHLRSGVRNRATKRVTPVIGKTPAAGQTDITTTSLSSAAAMTIGKVGGTYADFEFMGMAVFRAALTTDELRRLAIELGVTP